MAEFLFKDLVKKEGLENEFYISSSATSLEEIGNPIHPGTKAVLREKGIEFDNHRAAQLTKSDYKEFDYIIAMDSFNIRNIIKIIDVDSDNKVYKLLDFCDGGDVKDPWYTGNFDETYNDILRGLNAFLLKLKN